MKPAEIELLPRVAEIVLPDVRVELVSGGWNLSRKDWRDWLSDEDMQRYMSELIADWIDGHGIGYQRIVGPRVLVALGPYQWFSSDATKGNGTTRLEAEMLAVLAWKEANP